MLNIVNLCQHPLTFPLDPLAFFTPWFVFCRIIFHSTFSHSKYLIAFVFLEHICHLFVTWSKLSFLISSIYLVFVAARIFTLITFLGYIAFHIILLFFFSDLYFSTYRQFDLYLSSAEIRWRSICRPLLLPCFWERLCDVAV